MLFAAKTLSDKTYCHFNGTEKRIEVLHLPKQFYIDGKLFLYHNQEWIQPGQWNVFSVWKKLNNKSKYEKFVR